MSGTNVIVAAGTPAGTYSLIYKICEIANPTNCTQATVAVTVNAPVIAAVNDTASINGLTGGTFTNVLANDTLNGAAVMSSQVNTTSVSSTNAGITLSGTNVIVAAGTPAGTYSLIYKICEISNPTNCMQATVAVTVNVKLPDFTPTIDIDNIVFLTEGVTRDFVVNISEIGGGISVGQLVFKIPLQSAFTITYGSASTTVNVLGGVSVSNNNWTITENSLFITATLKPSLVIGSNLFSSVGFSITRKANVPPHTWQPITATIVNTTGSDSVTNNNTYNTVVKAQ